MRQNSRALWLGIGLVCLLLSGCYKETVTDDVTTVTYAWWVTLATLIGSLVAMAAGWAIRQNEGLERWCWILIGGGALALAIFLPATFVDKVVVDSQHFALRTGFWFMPTTHDIKFADISRMELQSETRLSRRGKRTSYFLNCTKKQGGSERVPVGDMLEEAIGKVVIMAAVNNVDIVDSTGK